MDQNLIYILNWVKDVLNGFGGTVLLVSIWVGVVSLFFRYK